MENEKLSFLERLYSSQRVFYRKFHCIALSFFKQEAALLRDMQDRLGNSEQKIANLESTNKNLAEKVKLMEEKYKRAKQQNG